MRRSWAGDLSVGAWAGRRMRASAVDDDLPPSCRDADDASSRPAPAVVSRCAGAPRRLGCS
ncbi:hypothetical protein ACFSM7_05180 [Clavibacter michiganensis subsp. tessellarius]|uniref:hypothetical protein n=1 Tax=Clavibacter tessellarius TaxID=31965 RepID=UPI0036441B73